MRTFTIIAAMIVAYAIYDIGGKPVPTYLGCVAFVTVILAGYFDRQGKNK